MVNTPVLFETFARYDYARQVFDAIKEAKPRKLYFYSNKARPDRADEVERNELIRGMVKEIDWECELHTWFRDEYVDVYTSLKGAISWFFEREEQGVVLEEDCVPSLAFFDYCEKLLNKYKDDRRIWFISGDNYYPDYNPNNTDYIFTHFFEVYGWASWRDRWNEIKWGNSRVDEMIGKRIFQAYFGKSQGNLIQKLFSREMKLLDVEHAWDGCFWLAIMQNNGLCIFPSKNLVTNIGELGVHGQGESHPLMNLQRTSLEEFPIEKEPEFIINDFRYDLHYYNVKFKKNYGFVARVKSILYRILKCVRCC